MTRCPPPLEALSQTPIKHNPFTCKLEHALEKSRSKQKIEQRMQEEGGRGDEGRGRKDEGVVATCLRTGRRRSSGRQRCWAGAPALGRGVPLVGAAA